MNETKIKCIGIWGVVSAYFREHFSVLPEEGIAECSQEMALVLMEALRGFRLETG